MKNIKQIQQLREIELLALLSAASVLKKKRYFTEILKIMLTKKISHKKIYEALLQTYLFAGFPSALVSLKEFNQIVNHEIKYRGYDLNKYLDRGIANCRKIYGKKFEILISNIKIFSPEMSEWLIVEGYGKVLGRKGLSLKEREICIVSTLATLKFNEQLYSHLIGAINIKVEANMLLGVMTNLSLISAKSSSKFGEKILMDYLTK